MRTHFHVKSMALEAVGVKHPDAEGFDEQLLANADHIVWTWERNRLLKEALDKLGLNKRVHEFWKLGTKSGKNTPRRDTRKDWEEDLLERISGEKS